MTDTHDIHESEQELVATAQQALSSCNWTVGECAAKWCQRYAYGRTDADFGAFVNLSGDQIYERRRVWERFGVSGMYRNFEKLRWSHFRVAMAWPDADDCLQWSDENGATVAEMKAWRRMLNGDDLTIDNEPEPVQLEEEHTLPAIAAEPDRDPRETETTTAAAAPQYSPFRSDSLKEEKPPTANMLDEAVRVRRCLARLGTAARELSKIGHGRWFDLLRDHLDQLAEDARQHEEPTGLDRQTIDSVIQQQQTRDAA